MEGKLVTAIITTHDRLHMLKRAIESVYNQSYKNIELIVVDDCSADGTKEYCEAQDFQYIYIPKEDSKGGNHARNVGVQSSHGDYVAFLDDDDYWFADKIEKQMRLMEEKQCGVVYCGRRIETVNEDKSITYFDLLPTDGCSGDLSRRTSVGILTSMLLIKKQYIEEVGYFDENLRFWQDYELLLRLAQITQFYYINEVLIGYRNDMSESKRLSNKYYSWKEAVKYIEKKHKNIYSGLSFIDKLRYKRTIYCDAACRAATNGLRIHAAIYRRKCLLVDFILRHLG